jgi:predicted phosphodiesterase
MTRNNPTGRRLRSLFVLAALCGALLVPAQDRKSASEQLVKGPVIQNVTTTQATINWVTMKRLGRYRTLGPGGRREIEELSYHQEPIRGLKPGTHYTRNLKRYGIDVEINFDTPPKGDAPFSFIAFGDTRTRHEVHKRIVDRILPEKPSFVIHTGDLVGNGESAEDWDRFFEIERDLLRNAAFYPTLGNHDRNAPVFFRYFTFPGGNGRHYSFNWGNAHIAALDTDQIGNSGEEKSTDLQRQADWLREDLRQNKKPLVFVFSHHPLYTAIEKRRAEAAKLAEILEAVMIEGGVTAVFAGHDHNYQHHLKGGLHFIVTGGGGAPLYDVSPIPGVTLKAVKTENYVRVRVEGKQAKVEAFDLKGDIIDAFDLQGKP